MQKNYVSMNSKLQMGGGSDRKKVNKKKVNSMLIWQVYFVILNVFVIYQYISWPQ